MRIRRLGAGAVCVTVLAATVAACSSGSTKAASPRPQPGKVAKVVAVPADAWILTLRQVKADGTVSLTTALSAFALAIGPVPGARVTPGPRPTTMSSGTIAVDWVFSHWGELTAAQRQAVFKDLGAQPIVASAYQPAATAVLLNAPLTPPVIECPAASSADAGAYLARIPEITNELSTHLGVTLHLKVYVVMNTTAVKDPDGEGVLYTYGCNGKTASSGALNNCVIHVNPVASTYSASDQVSFLIHEMVHCFVFNAVGGVETSFPSWYKEGSATWAEVKLGGGDTIATEYWREYLQTATEPLFERTYDAVGFFVHLEESGVDAWHTLLPMAKALASSGVSNAAAWKAAHVSTEFRDTWGSGYAQGDYPGTAWTSGGEKGFPHQPSDLNDETLRDGGTIPVLASAAATAAYLIDVQAQVVLVSGGPNGRISLGGGTDVTLESTTNPYCTMGNACKCPAGSVNDKTVFARIGKGFEYLGATGGLAQAKVTLTGMTLDDYCGKSCLVGTWKVTNEVVALEGASGGAGATWYIRANGTAEIVHDGSYPLVNAKIGFSIRYEGSETETWKILTNDNSGSGTWAATTVSGGVAARVTTGGVSRLRNIGFSPGYRAVGTWSCRGNVMSTTFAAVGETVTLSRA